MTEKEKAVLHYACIRLQEIDTELVEILTKSKDTQNLIKEMLSKNKEKGE